MTQGTAVCDIATVLPTLTSTLHSSVLERYMVLRHAGVQVETGRIQRDRPQASVGHHVSIQPFWNTRVLGWHATISVATTRADSKLAGPAAAFRSSRRLKESSFMEDIAKNIPRESVLWGLYWMTRGFCGSRWIRVLLLQHSSGRNAVCRVLLMYHHHARVRRWPCGARVQWASCSVVSRMSSAMKKAWKACFGQICKYAFFTRHEHAHPSVRGAYLLQIWIPC